MNARRRSFLRLATLATSAALIAGCSTYVEPPITARQDPYQPEQINLTSWDLRNRTAVDAPLVTRDDGGLLHVTVPIRSTGDKQLYIDYRVAWLDRDHAVINETGWIRKTLPPNVHDQFSVNSTSPLAANFRIDIRYAQ